MQPPNHTIALVLRLGRVLGLIAALQAVPSAAQDLSIAASLDRAQAAVNETFQLTIELSGANALNAGQPELPDLNAFAAYSGSSSAQNIQLVNGKMNATRSFIYHFIARKTGSFKIPPVSIQHDGKTLQTDPLEIEIVKVTARRSPAAGSNRANGATSPETLDDNLFFRASVNRKSVYQGEPVIVEYKIFTRVQVTNYAFTSQPNYGDFWAEEFEGFNNPRLQNETVNGQTYRVATLKKVALFPTSPGKKTIPGLGLEASVRMRERRGRRSIFDQFLDDPFFGRSVTHQMISDPVEIDVLPLPAEGQPPGFDGAVGSYRLTASLDREKTVTNEPVTLTVRLSGEGNLKFASVPQLSFPASFEAYDPKIRENLSKNGAAVRGNKAYEYLLIPRRPGAFTLPAATFSYFDPKAKKYKTLTTRPIDLQVGQGEQVVSNASSGLSKSEVRLLGQDIRYIAGGPPAFLERDSQFYRRPVFWIFMIAPALVLVLGLGYRNHQDRLSGNVAWARSRKAQKVAQANLKRAREALNAADYGSFYAESGQALTRFVGNKLNLQEGAMVTDEISGQLRDRGVSDALSSRFEELLAECDFRRFTNAEAPESEARAFFERVRSLVEDLERSL